MTDVEREDFQRAAALISHRAHGNAADAIEGVRAIIQFAVDDGRLVFLLRTVDHYYRMWIEELRTEGARAMVDELIADIASESAADDIGLYNQLAARAILAMKAEDGDKFAAVAEEANTSSAGANGGSRLVGALSDLYHYILPELATPSGRKALSEWTATIAGLDDGS